MSMKKILNLLPFVIIVGGTALPAQAQSVYRCGNEYTNNADRIRQGGCSVMTGGNLTIVRGSTIAASAGIVRPARATSSDRARAIPVNSPSPGRTVDDAAQRTRDAGARNILQTELTKASSRLAELQKEYNNGEPEKMGPEHRNYQKYLDRVAELKASIARTESDIAGLRRELGRSGG